MDRNTSQMDSYLGDNSNTINHIGWSISSMYNMKQMKLKAYNCNPSFVTSGYV